MMNRKPPSHQIRTGFACSAGLLLVVLLCLTGCQCPGRKTDLSFDRPLVICKSPDETRLYIYDSRHLRVLVTDPDFHLLNIIQHPSFESVQGMCVNAIGELLMTNIRIDGVPITEQDERDMGVAEILIFSAEGTLVDTHSWAGEKGPIIFPYGISSLPDRSYFVSDIRQNMVFHLDRGGTILNSFGSYGDEPGGLYTPADIQVLPDGSILIADGYNSRLQRFHPTGAHRDIPVGKGASEGLVLFPQNLAFDEHQNIFCAEAGNMRISRFSPDFRLLQILRPQFPPGHENPMGVFELMSLVYLTKTGTLYVTDPTNNLIHLFNREGKWERAVSGVLPPPAS